MLRMSGSPHALLRVVAVLGFGGLAIFLLTRVLFPHLPDETVIRRTLISIESGFNRADVGDCMKPLDVDFEEHTTGLDRDAVRDVLRFFFRTDRSSKRDDSGTRARFDVDSLEILPLDPPDRDTGKPQPPPHAAAFAVRFEVELNRAARPGENDDADLEGRISICDIEIEAECFRQGREARILSAGYRVTRGRLP